VLPPGYLFLKGETIGNVGSGATARANIDQASLFVHLWDSLADTEAPVSGGRGASGVIDFNAGKTLTLPDMRQKFPIGKAAAGTGSVAGGTGGTIDLPHTHTGPSHTHAGPLHNHTIDAHSHAGPAHVHDAGGLRAAVGWPLDNAATGIRFLFDGNNGFTSSHRWTAPGVSIAGIAELMPLTTYVLGDTNVAGNGPTSVTALTTNYSGSGDTGAAGTGATGTNAALNPPFLATNYIIKY